MGYYTEFTLETKLTKEEEEKLNEISSFCYKESLSSTIKWYNYDEQMLNFSKIFPNKTFILRGDGESSGDHWVNAYRNGNVLRKEIKLPYFSEEELKKLENE